jgi:hypothetical protein
VPVAAAAAFFVIAIVAAILLSPGPGALVGDDATQAFVDAWRASRLATYAAETSFERRSPDGAALVSPGRVVQRPPDRLLEQFGAVDGQLDGHLLLCNTDPSGRYRCTEGAAVPDYEAEVDRQAALLASYFVEPRPLYRVTGDGHGCFRLLLALDFPSPPYGTSAQLCFDGRTGAQVQSEIIRPETTEIVTVTSLRTTVTDADLEVPDQPPAGTTTPATTG